MKKLLLLGSLLMMSTLSFADVLNGSRWQTIDDVTGKPKAIIQFTQQANGTFKGTIVTVLDPASAKSCANCAGSLKGKPLQGVTVVSNLKAVSTGVYEGGQIFDPKTGKTYKLKAELTSGGQKLSLRGYIGVSLIGRTQTWNRVK